ncbi:MAG: DUF2185 domain-containing protein [Candidatus Gastranaerophilales bacterium]|nr:DUF2185 domain-containing protein [Candidatus Gastranaerophilales bacterium]
MNRILNEVKEIIDNNLKAYLPNVKKSDLENNGAIYYMNGKDGTEFDWYVNDKLPPFMTFYNDEENLGAAKLLLYKSGEIAVYLYGENGKQLVKEVSASLDVTETELFELAVILKNEADDHKLWDADIEKFHTDIAVKDKQRTNFIKNEKNYTAIRNRKILLNLYAYVSKEITKEGWKVGYMERKEPLRKGDSGWFFFAGTGDEATTDVKQIELVQVGRVWQQFDSDIFKYIDMPVGTRLIRISEKDFEIDRNDKEIYTVKRM